MADQRAKRIIAVFGGGDADIAVAEFAETVGEAIAAAGQIVLTGGTGPADRGVKGRALCGAARKEGPWIGIARGDAVACETAERSIQITSNLGHKRNYLEALMCDAAIILSGKEGTESEAGSALSVGRPAAFARESWQELCRRLRSDRSGAAGRLVDVIGARFRGARAVAALDDPLAPDSLRRSLAGALRYEWFPSSASAEHLVDWVVSTLPAPSFPGTFPRGVHDEIYDRYVEWLDLTAS